jgi:FtsZ-binding cell division protein ZapB
MPGSVVIALAGLAAGTWKEMWRLYNERYGKWGEETVRRLQREIEDVKADNVSLGKMLDIMRDQLDRARNQATHFHSQWLDSNVRANELAARLNEAMTRLERADLSPNPYDEGEPGVPEPTERTDP